MTRAPASFRSRHTPRVRGPCITPAREPTTAPTPAMPPASGSHMWAPKRGRGTPAATAIGASLDTIIVAAFSRGRLAQGGRAPSPGGGRGTKMLPIISTVFTIKLLCTYATVPGTNPSARSVSSKSPKWPRRLRTRAGGGPEWALLIPRPCEAVQSTPAPSRGGRTRSSKTSASPASARRPLGLDTTCRDARGSRRRRFLFHLWTWV